VETLINFKFPRASVYRVLCDFPGDRVSGVATPGGEFSVSNPPTECGGVYRVVPDFPGDLVSHALDVGLVGGGRLRGRLPGV